MNSTGERSPVDRGVNIHSTKMRNKISKRKIRKCIECFIDNENKCTAKCKLGAFGRQCQLFIVKTVLENMDDKENLL